ncbi:hypothetical protein CWE12_07185 [Aliidiomarina sedimenti]|uniref:Bacterial bifunctional deaminase-reductase C-terminal domain-containing protein n=1 Tax=Aliidiomarina sedimenti TaxID=1933879 RepID=A0ABY0BYM9_9GAMM|nr:dihydrofolate reductase family protein [Aliidiomarina sedimenti]RUO29748.1 hypothetical protein CWE12_07185 [Aliidiomarina sedimenti]
MAHVVHSINVTAGGSCHHQDSSIDDAHLDYATQLTRSAAAMLLGRHTFELFMQFWPQTASQTDLPAGTLALATAFHHIPKLVVSGTSVAVTWNNTTQIKPGLESIRQTLAGIQGRVVIFGSPSLADSLLNEGLVNELHIVAQPYIGVADPRAFTAIKQRIGLSLLGVDWFESGSVLLRYKVNEI